MSTPTLSTRAMLVTLNICMWSARRHDRAVSQEVATKHGTDAAKTGRYNKILINPEFLAPVEKAANAARDWHEEQTLPWLDKGQRILPADNYWTYMQAKAEKEVAFKAAAAAFCRRFDPEYLDEARTRLGDLFDASEYPAAHELPQRFGFAVRVQPMPDSKDFRVTLTDEEMDAIRRNIADDMEAAQQKAMRDLWDRAHGAVSRMHERLTKYEPGQKVGVFRDSLVGNVRELADLLPRLNVAGDPRLDAIARRLKEDLGQHEAADLRQDANKRGATAQAAAAIMAQMSAYMGPMPGEQAA